MSMELLGVNRVQLVLAGCYMTISVWCYAFFSKGVWIRDSNEAEVLAILEALRIFSRSFQGSLIVESDSSKAILWVS